MDVHHFYNKRSNITYREQPTEYNGIKHTHARIVIPIQQIVQADSVTLFFFALHKLERRFVMCNNSQIVYICYVIRSIFIHALSIRHIIESAVSFRVIFICHAIEMS